MSNAVANRRPRRIYLTTAIPYVNGEPHIGHALELVQVDALARAWRARRPRGPHAHRHRRQRVEERPRGRGGRRAGGRLRASARRRVRRSVRPAVGRVRRRDPHRQRSTPSTRRRASVAGVRRAGRPVPAGLRGRVLRRLRGLPRRRRARRRAVVARSTARHPTSFGSGTGSSGCRATAIGSAVAIESGALRIEPASRRNEVLAQLRSGLRDISVSRSIERAHGWGIPVPDDPSQVVYVWFDALANYVTALGQRRRRGTVVARRRRADPSHRQGHHPLPRPLLAGDPGVGGPAAADRAVRARLPDGRRRQDLEVDRQRGGAGRARRAVRHRCRPLVAAQRVTARCRHRLHRRAARPAGERRSRQRSRQPRHPHGRARAPSARRADRRGARHRRRRRCRRCRRSRVRRRPRRVRPAARDAPPARADRRCQHRARARAAVGAREGGSETTRGSTRSSPTSSPAAAG